MKSSSIIVLFGDPPPPMRRGPSSLLVSLFVHACAFALLFLGLNQARTVEPRSLTRFSVRVMELRKQQPQIQRPVPKPHENPGQQPKLPPAVASGASPDIAAAQHIPLDFIPKKQAVQTIIQPQAPPDLTIPQEAAIPQVVVWSAQDMTVKKIVQPAPKTPTEVAVRPSVEAPNQESHVADIKISSSAFDTKAPLPPPSTTSPITASASTQSQKIPETASKDSGKPTPSSVISLSNIQLQEGTAVLPMVNEVAPTTFPGSLSAGQPKSSSPTGTGKAAEGKPNGTTAGNTSGNAADKGAAAGGSSAKGGTNGLSGAEASVATGASQLAVVHITLPKDGKFGVVVVGSSIAEDYPETVHLWSGRLAYTVYLHVGETKNWILQYSVPRSQGAVAVGGVSRPDAPWPYDITRPSVDADSNTDAIMVHGFVNAAGRFEQLAVVFPTELAEAKFLLHALQQWQFRPAMQNGQATQVEVLLIIPDQTE
jgi:hypothetical protein